MTDSEQTKQADQAPEPEAGLEIMPDPNDSDTVFVRSPSGGAMRIRREDADPEHRFVTYQAAAKHFGNKPQPQ